MSDYMITRAHDIARESVFVLETIDLNAYNVEAIGIICGKLNYLSELLECTITRVHELVRECAELLDTIELTTSNVQALGIVGGKLSYLTEVLERLNDEEL